MATRKPSPEVVLVKSGSLDDTPEEYIGRIHSFFSATVQLRDGVYVKSEIAADIPYDTRTDFRKAVRAVGNRVIQACLDQANAGAGAVNNEL